MSRTSVATCVDRGYLTADAISKLIGVSRGTVMRWYHNNLIDAIIIPSTREVRISAASLLRLLKINSMPIHPTIEKAAARYDELYTGNFQAKPPPD